MKPAGKKMNSKRKTLKTKHKIEKRVAERNKKVKKAANRAKKNGVLNVSFSSSPSSSSSCSSRGACVSVISDT